jgi:hypothetical protein
MDLPIAAGQREVPAVLAKDVAGQAGRHQPSGLSNTR